MGTNEFNPAGYPLMDKHAIQGITELRDIHSQFTLQKPYISTSLPDGPLGSHALNLRFPLTFLVF